MSAVYLIHCHGELGNPDTHTARHYLGYAENVEERLQKHASGNGSAFMAEVARRNIEWECVRIWENGNRTFERRLKNQKNHKHFCPICSGEAAMNRGNL